MWNPNTFIGDDIFSQIEESMIELSLYLWSMFLRDKHLTANIKIAAYTDEFVFDFPIPKGRQEANQTV